MEPVVVGIGIDVVEVSRIESAMQSPRFLARVLTERERDTFREPHRVAGRWAAKEAIFKALGRAPLWQDVEVLNDETGRPRVWVASLLMDSTRHRIHVSVTHERAYAAAVAVLESFDHLGA